jgi:hypothetical protein
MQGSGLVPKFVVEIDNDSVTNICLNI